ncbi:hypothetical protein ACO0RG_004465 [Hanseniaspora osmophila]|mgnify:FL=1
MSVLTRSRLLYIQNSIPLQQRNNLQLSYIWYLSAAATLSICNQPQDVKTVYKYALLQDMDKSLDDDFQIKHFTPLQQHMTRKFKEALLKSSCIGGLPKAINSLHSVASAAATKEQDVGGEEEKEEEKDKEEDKFRFRSESPNFVRKSDYESESKEVILKRGNEHFRRLYSKVSDKIITKMNGTSPDLWYTVLSCCYGPILSNEEVLNDQESSIVVISSLIPQNVNPQLYGHLKGALNIDCDKNFINSVQNLSLEISEWCGIYLKEKSVRL